MSIIADKWTLFNVYAFLIFAYIPNNIMYKYKFSLLEEQLIL